jgi:hypothetical protein
VQFDDLVDDQHKTPAAPGGEHAGISFDSLQDDSETYGSTTGALKAAGLGAARAASFGLSDEAITRLGLMKPEELTAYKEQNPIATGAGEAAGILGAVLAPEAGLLGAASAPVKAVARAGSGITKAILPVAEGAVGKIVGSAVAAGAGSAVEGAAYGLGQSVSEHAIGDPDALGEKLFSNVGYGAAFGGGLGAIFGAAKGAIQTKFPKFLSETDKAAIDAGDWGAMAHASDLPEAEKEGFVSALTKKKVGASDIEAAAKELDAPVLPGMVSDNKLVQKAQSALLEGPPSYPAMRAQNIANQGFERAESAAQMALGAEEDITKANLGETLKMVVSDSVEQQAAPINDLYAEIKNRYQTIPTSDKAIEQIARNIRNLEDVPFSPQAKAIAESAASRLESIKTVDDIKRLRSILNQELGLGATPIEKRVTSVIADKLADFEENSIVRFAEREMKTSVAKDKIMSLLDQREAANAQYTVFKDKIQRLGEVLGRKRVHGAQDFLDFVDGLTPEKIADKLSGKNNSEFLSWFSKELPDGMQSISAYQKGIIREAAMKDGRLNANKVVSSVFKLPKEYREKIFSAEELRKLEHVKTYLDAFPKNFNPSNTDNAAAFRAVFEHPVGAAVANARDFAIQGFLDSAVDAGDKTKAFIDGLSTIERNAAKTAKSMANGVGAIFTLKEAGTPVKGYLAMTREDRQKDHDKTRPHVADLNANPEKMIDKLNENTQVISEFAPKTAAGVQKTMIRATEFLNSKLPGANAPKKPLSGRYQPSDSELSKWHKYFSAVERPIDVLHNVANGNLVPEQVEALSYVYPKLMNEMRFKVTDKMTEHIGKQKPIPYKTKLSLSLFLGEDLVNSLTPVNMLANQNMMATATQAKAIQEKMPSANKNDLGKMERANSFLTPLQKSTERQDA